MIAFLTHLLTLTKNSSWLYGATFQHGF